MKPILWKNPNAGDFWSFAKTTIKGISMDLVGLIYVSIRRHSPQIDPQEELRRIHAESNNNNPRLNITGVLLSTKNHYIQFIEGEEKVVMDLFAIIEKDKGHYNLKVRRSAVLDERHFPEWSMNVVSIESINQALYGITHPGADANPYHLSSEVLFGLLSSAAKRTLCEQTQVA
ncbi:MAG: BLUF domain-containing protein [Hyphomicrobiales bacterium]